MGTVARLQPNRHQEQTASLGMVVFLASWAMMFAGLFFGYAFVRSSAGPWPPPGVPVLPVGLPALNTAVLLGSSVLFTYGLAGLRRGKRGLFVRALAGTIVLGAVFLALQLHVWRSVWQAGLHIDSGLYGSVFYSLTAFHALHVAVGLLILLNVLVGALRGKYTEHNTVPVRLCTMFWHFVDVVWILMFVTIYLL